MLSYLLLVDGDALEGLLDDPTAVHLQGKLLDVGSELQTGEDSYFIIPRVEGEIENRCVKSRYCNCELSLKLQKELICCVKYSVLVRQTPFSVDKSIERGRNLTVLP